MEITWAIVLVGLIGIVIVIVLAIRRLLFSRALKTASDMAKQVFPVWAAQGPFDSGVQSAAAMRNAYLAVFGANQTEEMADAIEGHEAAYDADPETWEETRRTALKGASSDALTLAEGIAAAEGLNKSLLEDGGHRLEFTKLSDGSTGLAYKQTWSDEDIEKKKKEDNEAIVSGIGQGLLKDVESSNEAREFVEFLSDLYRAEINEEPDASALGRVWLALFSAGIEKDEPETEPETEIDPEILKTFKRLNDAHQATMPSDLEWSENPGCFERHLKRKHENPLFPEPDREVTQEQIDEARERDQQDAADLKEEVIVLISDLEKLPELATTGDLSSVRERLDDLLDKAVGIGGEADATKDSLNTLRRALIDSMREGLKDNDEALKAIEKAEAFHQERVKTIHTPFAAQLLRIKEEDLIPALLSESPETTRLVMQMMKGKNKKRIINAACDLLESVLAEGADIPLANEKLKAIRGKDD